MRLATLRFLLGTLLGAFLGLALVPDGLRREYWPIAPAERCYELRAFALLVVGIALSFFPRVAGHRRPWGDLILGLALGHGLRLVLADSTEGLAALLMISVLFILPLAQMILAVPEVAAGPGEDDAEAGPEAGSAGRSARANSLSWHAWSRALELGAGLGAALALEGLTRQLRRFGGQSEEEDWLLAAVFMSLAAIGAVTLGRFLVRLEERSGQSSNSGRLPVIALACAALSTWIGMGFLGGVGEHAALLEYLQGFGLDTSLHGTTGYLLALAAPAYVLPAMAVGVALYGALDRWQPLALFAGASIGLRCVLPLLELPASMEGAGPMPMLRTSVDLMKLGSGLALGCGLARFFMGLVPGDVAQDQGSDAGRGPSSLGTLVRSSMSVRAILALLIGGSAVLLPLDAPPLIRPWELRVVLPSYMVEMPEGLLSVEPRADGLDLVSLDGRALTPLPERALADAEQIRSAVALLPEAVRARGFDVLLLGQLTPGRALALREAGARRIDRTGAWWAAMAEVERVLYTQSGLDLPGADEGQVISAEVASARRASGSYDLELALAVPGRTPMTPIDDERITALGFETEGSEHEDTAQPGVSPLREAATELGQGRALTSVLYVDASDLIGSRKIEGTLLLTAQGLEQPAVGLVRPARNPGAAADAPAFLPAGKNLRRPALLAWLGTRVDRRRELGRALLGARLAAANPAGDWSHLAAGLAGHWDVQRHSSPFESAAQRVELDETALRSLRAAALARRPDAFTRSVWNYLAAVFVERRDVEEIYEFLEPLEVAWAPWPELTVALANADLESLEPVDALARLQPALREEPGSGVLLELKARAQVETGDDPGALATLRRLQLLQPTRPGLRRSLGMVLLRLGQQEGRQLLQQHLREVPLDREIGELLGRAHNQDD